MGTHSSTPYLVEERRCECREGGYKMTESKMLEAPTRIDILKG